MTETKQAEMRKVELPDIVRVHDWLEANGPELTYRIKMESIPNTDARVMVEHNYNEMQGLLLTLFCMALVKGDV